MSDRTRRTSGSERAIVKHSRREILAIFGIVGTALGAFNGLDAFLEFCVWVRLWMVHWEELIRRIWDAFSFLTGFQVPEGIRVGLTTWLFALGTFASALEKEDVIAKEHRKQHGVGHKSFALSAWRNAKAVVIALLQALVISGGMTGILWLSSGQDGREILTRQEFLGVPMLVHLAVAAMCGVFVTQELFNLHANLALIIKRLFRIGLLMAVLTIFNFIGLYADAIREGVKPPASGA